MPLEEGSRLGPYQIRELLGRGAMGEVYRAHDERLGRDVALKVLPQDFVQDDDARSRLIREARVAAQLNPPHICTIHEVGEADGRTYIAMERIDGRPLASLIDERRLPLETVIRYGTEIAAALADAHEHGVVHRDLKCANVMITAEG